MEVVTEIDLTTDHALGTPLTDYEWYSNVGYDAFIHYTVIDRTRKHSDKAPGDMQTNCWNCTASVSDL